MPVVLDELNAAGLSFTQACGDVWRNIVGCPLAGVDGHELIDSRPLIRGAGRAVRGRSPVLQPAAQVQGIGVGLHPRLRPARDQRCGAGSGREGRRDRLRRVGRRRTRSVRADGSPAGRLRPAGRGRRGVRGDHRDLPRRGQPHQAHPGPDQVPRGRVGSRAAARRGRGQAWSTRARPRSPRRPPIDPHRDHLGIHPQNRPGSTTSARPPCGADSRPTR